MKSVNKLVYIIVYFFVFFKKSQEVSEVDVAAIIRLKK